MLKSYRLACVLVAALALGSPALAQTEASPTPPPSLKSLFQEPVFSGATLSPKGDKVAFKVRIKDQRARLVVLDLNTQQSTVVASFNDASVGQVNWVNNNRLVFDLAVWLLPAMERDFNAGLFAVNADGSNFKELVESVSYFAKRPDAREMLPQGTRFLRSSAKPDSDDVWVTLVEAWDKKVGADYRRIKRLNTVTGRWVDVDSPPHASHWVFDDQDELRAVSTDRRQRLTMEYRDVGGPWRVLSDQASLEGDIVPLSIDSQDQLYVSSRQKGGFAGVYRWDFKAQRPAPTPVAHVDGFDIFPYFLKRQSQLVGLRFTADASVTLWLQKDAQALQDALDKALPASVNELSFARQGDSPHVLVHSFSDRNPGVSYVFNRATKKFTNLGEARPDLKGKPMGELDLIRIKARDGREVPTYLTLPPGASKKGLPLVVVVHGGPWSRGGDWRWNEEVQLLATRGYAVLQPEFRGSTGFGADHFRAGWKQWGLAMQDDVTDATRWAITQGIADPQRICIIGASYGGYATMMGLIKEPELYRCGINWVGVSDPQLLYSVGWSDMTDAIKEYGLPQLLGDPVKEADLLKAASPLQQASRLKAPLLMVYGAKDERVPLIHGEKMRDALKPHNSNVEWVVFPDAGHGWADEETQINFWGRVEKFLAKHLPPTHK